MGNNDDMNFEKAPIWLKLIQASACVWILYMIFTVIRVFINQ
jgi:hypothetical protein